MPERPTAAGDRVSNRDPSETRGAATGRAARRAVDGRAAMTRTRCDACDAYAVAYLGNEGKARYECPECDETWVETRDG